MSYTPTQIDALTFAKVNVLRYKGANTAPVLLHDRTAAIFNSDFTTLLRMNIHGLVIETLCSRADQYEGQSTLDGLQMTSMQSAMDQDMVNLTKRVTSTSPTPPSPPRRRSRTWVRPLLRQDIPGAFVLSRSKRLARGARPRPEPWSVIETKASRPAWRSAASSFVQTSF